MYLLKASLFVVSALVAHVVADTPANCTYEDIKGVWEFYEGERSENSEIDCEKYKGPTVNILRIKLLFPDTVVDDLGNKGYWTIIYNQGFEVVINYRKYFAFSKYEKKGTNVTSYCDTVLPGWSHDVLGKNWACYNAHKILPIAGPKVHFENPILQEGTFKQDKDFVNRINKVQKSWTATIYPELEGLPISDIIRRAGGVKSKIHRSPRIKSPKHRASKRLFTQLPEEFDWRNVGGVNYVSPVRDQGACGSCYAFSSLAMYESRLRIVTNNTLQVTFSPQDLVSCSQYSQGCEGGFPYLIAGKYGEDFGVVAEKCDPYTGKEDKCSKNKCKRHYATDYKYVGGFYGACNEEEMKFELVSNGPIAVGFFLYKEFMQYAGGIYHHTGLDNFKFNPFENISHAVLVIGYGVDSDSGEKYWIVKNSWGSSWGEEGFFRIRRGNDECGIESAAVAAMPIP